MTAPADSYVQVPSDTNNTGKKMQAQSETIGANSVHTHYVIPRRRAKIGGVYRAALDQQTVQASAQNGTSTGVLWAHVPTAISGKLIRLRACYFDSHHSTALATPTAPRLRLVRFTFTGTASGATVTPAQVDASAAAPVLDLRTAVTGLTVSLVAAVGAGALCGAVTAVGAYAPSRINLLDRADDEDEWVILAPGEGVVLYQDTAGTTSDTRKFNPVLVWDEIDNS